MLRRKPTAITITLEDIIAFEENRLRQQQQHQRQGKYDIQDMKSSSLSETLDPSDELKPLPGDKAKIVRSREERIGLARHG